MDKVQKPINSECILCLELFLMSSNQDWISLMGLTEQEPFHLMMETDPVSETVDSVQSNSDIHYNTLMETFRLRIHHLVWNYFIFVDIIQMILYI
jgi:hypothetical protein